MTVLACVKHLKHYIKLMRNAEARAWTKTSAPCYVEEHHIFIKSIFGKNNRVVYLTAREHFIAHLLLWKACRKRYGVQHWKTAKTGKALQSMSMKSKFTNERIVANSRTFEMVRIANVESMLGDNHWTVRHGVESPLAVLNKDPIRAKRIGEINQKLLIEKSRTGDHQWQNPEFIQHHTQRKIEEGWSAKGGAKMKGKLWWNNGVKQTRAFECPEEGWVRGRLPFPGQFQRKS